MSTKISKPRGRPRKSPAKRDTTISFRVSKSEREHLEQAAKNAGQELSDWARACLLTSRAPKPITPADVLVSRLKGAKPAQSSAPERHLDIAEIDLFDLCRSLNVKFNEPYFSKLKPNRLSRDGFSCSVVPLLNLYRRLSATIRRIAIASKGTALIEELLRSGVDICNTLSRRAIQNQVKHVAANHPSFPLAFYNHPILNSRNKRLLEEIKPGANLHGLRPESKWQRDEFVEHAISILEHMGNVYLHLKWVHSSQVVNNPKIPPRDLKVSDADLLSKFFPELSSSELSSVIESCNLLHRSSHMSLSKDEKAKVWKTIDKVIIENFRLKQSLLNYDDSWQDILADDKLRNAVSATCQQNTRSAEAEIKKRLKEKFHAVTDKIILDTGSPR